MIRQDTLSEAPEDLQPDLAGGHKNWLRKVIAESTQAKVGLIVLGIFVLLAIFAPLIAPYDPRTQVGPVYAPPSLRHPLGLDDGGVDMVSLLIYGGRISLIVGFAATLIAMVIGGGIGIFSGYFGGRTDQALMRITDYFLVIPDLPLAIIIAAVWGPSLSHLIFVIAILLWTTTARIIPRHVLPQIGPLLIANTVLTIAVAIFDETALAFLGLADPTSITWGTTIEFSFLRTAISSGAWWAVIPAGLCVALVIMACFWLGQAIEDALNPRLKVSYISPRSFRFRAVPREEDAG